MTTDVGNPVPASAEPWGRGRLSSEPVLSVRDLSIAYRTVAGDVRAESAKRVASAVGEGAMAVMLVHRYLEKL